MTDPLAAILAAFVAGLFALVVGWQQYRILRQQNRIAAFDRRFDAFLEVQTALQRVCVETAKPDIASLMALNRALQKCWFIFPRSLSTRLDHARQSVVQMRSLHFEIWNEDGSPRGASNETLNAYHSAQSRAVTEWESLRHTFRPHMNLD